MIVACPLQIPVVISSKQTLLPPIPYNFTLECGPNDFRSGQAYKFTFLDYDGSVQYGNSIV